MDTAPSAADDTDVPEGLGAVACGYTTAAAGAGTSVGEEQAVIEGDTGGGAGAA